MCYNSSMKEFIEEMEKYAQEYDIPIMQKEGIEFFQKLIVENHIQSILEIGSAIGYSAIQLARLDKAIHIVTIERDQERYDKAVENIHKCSLESQISIFHEDALEFECDELFDCIFIDAAKAQYIRFFERFEKNLKENGVIVSDNLSFHGYVENPQKEMSRNLRQLVRKIQKYIDYLKENDNYETLFINKGDGIAISRKKSSDVIK